MQKSLNYLKSYLPITVKIHLIPIPGVQLLLFHRFLVPESQAASCLLTFCWIYSAFLSYLISQYFYFYSLRTKIRIGKRVAYLSSGIIRPWLYEKWWKEEKEGVVRNFYKPFYFTDIFVLNNHTCIIESLWSGWKLGNIKIPICKAKLHSDSTYLTS